MGRRSQRDGDLLGGLGNGAYENKGDNPGEMGNNLPFVNAGSGTSIEAVSIGNILTCVAVTGSQGGGVKCWGETENGQLGIESRAPRGSVLGDSIGFTDIGDLSLHGAILQVVSGDRHSSALLVIGKLKCWGKGGQLGKGIRKMLVVKQEIWAVIYLLSTWGAS